MAAFMVGGGVVRRDVGAGRAARRPLRCTAQPFELQVRDRELGRLANASRAILGRGLEQGAGFGLIARRQLQQAEIHLGVADALGLRFLASGRLAMSPTCAGVEAPVTTSSKVPGHSRRSIFAVFARNSSRSFWPERTRATCSQITPSASAGARRTAAAKSSAAALAWPE